MLIPPFRLLVFTNQIVGNQEFSLMTLHTRGQNPKAIALQNVYMAIQTLKGRLGWTGTETQTMVKRPMSPKWLLIFILCLEST